MLRDGHDAVAPIRRADVTARRSKTPPRASILIEARGVSQRFGSRDVLRAVSLDVCAGEVCALLGPNGAGKTTLLRVLAGLVTPSAGDVRILGLDPRSNGRALRAAVGLVPSGDRTFYLRISARENLIFFGRLHGMSRREAARRAADLLDQVGLADHARVPVGRYSHGMQKRLSVARALLTEPAVLLVDEATHDLDPEGRETVRALFAERARGGTAIVWTTQQIDEVRDFAHTATVLVRGETRYTGELSGLVAQALSRRYVLQLRNGRADGALDVPALNTALSGGGKLRGTETPGHFVLELPEDVLLGDALASLMKARIDVVGCREERPRLEDAFLRLTREPS